MAKIFLTALGVAVIALAVIAAPDLQRYLKMRAM